MRILALILAFAFAPMAARADILVFAAASLKEPLDRIAAEVGGVTVSYAGSGTLAQQVLRGAPADVVVLANDAWMAVLDESGAVNRASMTDIASNRLVMIGAAGSAPLDLTIDAIAARRGDGRIATGLTGAVPAGIYAKQALQSLGLWDDLSPHLAEVDSVRSALTLVARGQTPLGIVYRTDVRISPDVAEVALFPETSHLPIRYTAALTTDAEPTADVFLAYLMGEDGQSVLAEAGFLPPVPEGVH